MNSTFREQLEEMLNNTSVDLGNPQRVLTDCNHRAAAMLDMLDKAPRCQGWRRGVGDRSGRIIDDPESMP